MSSPIADLEYTLQRHRQNCTASRRKVFVMLRESEPMTMAELINACGTDMDRASVYRTVLLFEKLGIIHRIQIGWKYKLELSDSFQKHHHHMFCSVCGSTFSIPEDDQLEARLHTLATTNGFVPESHQLEITGTCAKCLGMPDN